MRSVQSGVSETSRTGRARRLPLALAYAALLISCDNPLSPREEKVSRVGVDPQVLNLAAGANAPVAAHVFDDAGQEIVARVFWSSQNRAIATVSQAGVVTAVSPGATQIAASSRGVPAFVAVTVTNPPVAIVRLTPSATSVEVGSSKELVLEVLDAGGGQISGRTAVWSSSDPSVATVNENGIVSGVAPGAATIHATVDAVQGTAIVTVVPVPVATIMIAPPSVSVQVGRTQPLTATAADADGNALTGRTIVWSSSNDAIAAVSQQGVVTGVSPGTATVTASSPESGPGGSTPKGTATVTVGLVPVATMNVVPSTASIRVNETTNFGVNLFDAGGVPLTVSGRTVVWSSSDPTVATIDGASGVATGVAVGSAIITATVTTPGAPPPGSVEGTASLSVSNAPVASVVVTPDPATVHVGATYGVRFTATMKDALGHELTGRTVLWSSSNPAAASVDALAGVVTGVAPGVTQIRALSEGILGTASATIDLVPIERVDLSPPTATLVPPGTQQLIVTARDSSGGAIAGVALGGRSTSWNTSNAAAATISQTGLVTAVALGSATITATVAGKSATSDITVLAGTGSVVVAVAPDSLILPGTVSGTITVRDAGSNPLPGRSVAISSSNPAVATVAPLSATTSATGTVAITVTGVAAGSATINASSGGHSGSTALRMLNPVSTVTVTAPSDSIVGTSTLQATATLRDAGSVILTGRPIAWTSSSPSVATVNASTGLITGVADGTTTITATSESKQGTKSIRVVTGVGSVQVTANPDSLIGAGSLSANARVRDTNNNPLPGRTVTISSNNIGVATVSPSNATSGAGGNVPISVTSVSPGTATITATSSGVSGTLPVRMLASVNSVSVTAPADSIIGTATLQAAATLRDAGNNLLTGRPITWSSNATPVATVNSASGLITGVSPGTATITATVEGKSDNLVVHVLAAVGSVPVTAPVDTLIVGTGTLSATATVRDATSTPIPGRTVTIASSNPSVATVAPGSATSNGSGQVAITITGVAPGNVNITATSAGIVGSLPVHMLAPVNTVTVTAAGDSILGTGTLQATATLKDASNNTLTGRPVTWASGDPSLATVDPLTGLITGVSSGTVTITATSETKIGAYDVRVLAHVSTVTVTTPGDSILGTTSLQATATLKDAANNTLTGRPIIWASSDPSVATVDPSTGLITGVSAGNSTISATSEGQVGVVVVRVLAAVDTVFITPDPVPPLTVPTAASLTANVEDASHAALAGRACTVMSSDTNVATVAPTSGNTDPLGQIVLTVTPVATGTATITVTCEGKVATSSITVN